MENIQNNLSMIKIDWNDGKNNVIFNVVDLLVKEGVVKIQCLSFDYNKKTKPNINTIILDLKSICKISILNEDFTEGESIYRNNYNYIFDSEIWNNIKRQ